MWCSTRLSLRTTTVLLYINDFSDSATGQDFHLYADDSNLFCSHKDIQVLERNVNEQLSMVHNWLCANELSLNIEKSNYVLFHPVQKSPIIFSS